MNIMVLVSAFLGLLAGAGLTLLIIYFYWLHDENRYKKRSAIEKLYKEVAVRRNLNTKIIEILGKPVAPSDQDLVDPREDVKVSFTDYHFLKNYTSLHSLYIPTYFMDKFFTNLANHLAIFEDQEDLKNGGYIFRDSRRIFEDFSVVITDEMESKTESLNKAKNIYPSLLRRQDFDL